MNAETATPSVVVSHTFYRDRGLRTACLASINDHCDVVSFSASGSTIFELNRSPACNDDTMVGSQYK